MLKYFADSGWKSIHKFKYSGRTFELSVITVVFLKEKILCPVELNMFVKSQIQVIVVHRDGSEKVRIVHQINSQALSGMINRNRLWNLSSCSNIKLNGADSTDAALTVTMRQNGRPKNATGAGKNSKISSVSYLRSRCTIQLL
ncbi:hypothetical protein WN944_012912 [Citrus x changshan-huyou]|uniref:Uncharacterized protein n=1 Tax=Citrus x changshan-huyou TaxID=2935761 RepID=A0AAP0M404_9ROSI